MLRISTILLVFLLSGCMVGPNYKEPPKQIAEHWLKNDPTIKEAPIQNANWWQVFHDPSLSFLIDQGYQNNLSLKAAAASVLQARAQLAQSVGELYPQQQALFGNLNYNRIGGSSLQHILPSSFYTDLFGVTASWELDFWGKYRRAIRSNDATFLASFAAYDNALVSLTSDIATTYIDIRTTEKLLVITKSNVQIQAEALRIAKSRYQAGQTSLLDVQQAQTEFSQTEAQIPQLLSNLQQEKDRLAVFLGTTPDQMNALLLKLKNQGIPEAPLGVAVGIPVETLIKRPDIYEARLKAISQSEAIGAAKANLYPAFSLLGTFAFASNTINHNSLANIFRWSNRTITAGPSFNWPILNYGQITNAVREQDAAFQQALLNYLNLVLKAQQEVQDHITQFIESKKSERYLRTANNSAIKSTKLALIRYREGESDFTPVLDCRASTIAGPNCLHQGTGRYSQGIGRPLSRAWWWLANSSLQ